METILSKTQPSLPRNFTACSLLMRVVEMTVICGNII
jgi:hypothetical protein